MVSDMSDDTIRAAGGVLWRAAGGNLAGEPNVEVALVHRPRYDDWTFPKGKLSPGESDIEGAIREVREETGYSVRLGRALGETRYTKNTRWGPRPKVVRYWAMRAAGGTFTPNNEVDELRWVALDQAHEMLSFDRDREVLERFVRGPAVVQMVLLVRHASAGDSSKWEGDDRERPLDERGRRQAEGLVRLLSRFDVRAIVSADYVRCVETVEPLAEATGLAVKEEPLLSEKGYPGHKAEVVDLVRGLGSDDGATVVCTQGDVVPDLLRRLASEDDFGLPGDLVYKKASTWALSFSGGRLVGADYIPPPTGNDI